jgi:predicted ATP-grasp superfamily ATP-dependent carboligase
LGTQDAQTISQAGDYVIKPLYSCSGRGVSLHTCATPLPNAISDDINERALVQEKLVGRQLSTFAIAHRGRVLVNVVYEGTIMSGSVSVAFARIKADVVDEWVERFVEATQHSGFISFDFFLDGAGMARAIECNPRVTSGVHFIETDDLAQAILSPDTAKPRLKPVTAMMQFYPTLTEVQSRLYKPEGRQLLRTMMASRDVTWDARDPMPFVTMPITAFSIIAKSITQQKSFGEVSTADISWFEGDALVR